MKAELLERVKEQQDKRKTGTGKERKTDRYRRKDKSRNRKNRTYLGRD